jgi:hypothetical protein
MLLWLENVVSQLAGRVYVSVSRGQIEKTPDQGIPHLYHHPALERMINGWLVNLSEAERMALQIVLGAKVYVV